jgi:hypothetical protein
MEPANLFSVYDGSGQYLWANTASHTEAGNSFLIALECIMQLLSVGFIGHGYLDTLQQVTHVP